MGRRKAGVDPNLIERERKVPKTFSIPQWQAKELEACKNPSAFITTLLDENIHKISTLDETIKVREDKIKELIRDTTSTVYEEMKPKFMETVGEVMSSYKYSLMMEE